MSEAFPELFPPLTSSPTALVVMEEMPLRRTPAGTILTPAVLLLTSSALLPVAEATRRVAACWCPAFSHVRGSLPHPRSFPRACLRCVEVKPSEIPPVAAPRSSWLAVPSPFGDTNGSAPSSSPLPRPSRRRRTLLPSPALVPDGACDSPATPPSGINFHWMTAALMSLADYCFQRRGREGLAKSLLPRNPENLVRR